VPIELLGRSSFPPIGDLPYLITLPAYGFHWFVLAEAAAVPHWHEETPPPLPEFMTLVLREGWLPALTGREGQELEQQVLPAYFMQQRWFGAKDEGIAQANIRAMNELAGVPGNPLLLQVEVALTKSKEVQRYLLPLALSWSEDAGNRNWPLLPYMIARARRGSRVGAVFESTASEVFGPMMLEAIRANRSVAGPEGVIHFRAGRGLEALDIPTQATGHAFGGEQSNSSINIADKAVLKIYRRLAPGEHPEVELSRFLTETAGYANTPKLLGDIEYVAKDGTQWALGLMQEFVRSQGSGWEHAISYLDRVFDALRVVDAKVEPIEPTERHAIYLEQVRILARRIAELHLALASNDQIPAFKPEPISAQDLMLLQKRFSEASSAAFSALQVAQKNAAEPDASRLAALAARRGECIECFAALSQEPLTAMKTRIHGDLHLGQILVVQNDFHVIDFEGEPARTLAARRAKGSPLQDVAGMLRSFEYASWAALHKIADRDPDGLSRLLPHAEEWKRLVRSTFMDSYREAIAGCVSWPANAEEADRLLNLFLLDKVLYEIRYEEANRPSWLRIPLAGLAEILDGAAKIKERTLEPA